MKKLMMLVLAACCAGALSATELWWLVGESATVDGAKVTWDTAYLYASPDGSNFSGTLIGTTGWTKEDMADMGFAYSDIDPSVSSFYIELKLGETIVGNSYVNFRSDSQMAQGATTAAALSGAMYDGGMSMATPYQFNQFTMSQVVPEPTSGLMMLLGLAGLALRRRRA